MNIKAQIQRKFLLTKERERHKLMVKIDDINYIWLQPYPCHNLCSLHQPNAVVSFNSNMSDDIHTHKPQIVIIYVFVRT